MIFYDTKQSRPWSNDTLNKWWTIHRKLQNGLQVQMLQFLSVTVKNSDFELYSWTQLFTMCCLSNTSCRRLWIVPQFEYAHSDCRNLSSAVERQTRLTFLLQLLIAWNIQMWVRSETVSFSRLTKWKRNQVVLWRCFGKTGKQLG